MARGLFIALEGVDGSGTTTQRDLVGARLSAESVDVHLTCEPSEGPVGTVIRSILTKKETADDASLALMFAADRLDHLQREIEPARARGALVLTDRYILSSLAYQSISLPSEWVETINARAYPPDATLFLRVSAETAAQRRASRPSAPERFDALELQRRIAQSYEARMDDPQVGQLIVIDAEQSLEAVTDSIHEAIKGILNQHAPS